MTCEICGTRAEVEQSAAAKATVCLRCHLEAAPPTRGTDPDLRRQAAEVRADARELDRFADDSCDRRLKALAPRLADVALLVEVGADRETPEQLLRAAESLRSQAMKALVGR